MGVLVDELVGVLVGVLVDELVGVLVDELVGVWVDGWVGVPRNYSENQLECHRNQRVYKTHNSIIL